MRVSTRPPSHHLEAYSPECVEGGFSEVELPLYGVLRSSHVSMRRFLAQHAEEPRARC
jgi:hypothetical protein